MFSYMTTPSFMHGTFDFNGWRFRYFSSVQLLPSCNFWSSALMHGNLRFFMDGNLSYFSSVQVLPNCSFWSTVLMHGNFKIFMDGYFCLVVHLDNVYLFLPIVLCIKKPKNSFWQPGKYCKCSCILATLFCGQWLVVLFCKSITGH
jgi:hypothetical protein